MMSSSKDADRTGSSGVCLIDQRRMNNGIAVCAFAHRLAHRLRFLHIRHYGTSSTDTNASTMVRDLCARGSPRRRQVNESRASSAVRCVPIAATPAVLLVRDLRERYSSKVSTRGSAVKMKPSQLLKVLGTKRLSANTTDTWRKYSDSGHRQSVVL